MSRFSKCLWIQNCWTCYSAGTKRHKFFFCLVEGYMIPNRILAITLAMEQLFFLQSLITDGQPNKMPTAKGCLKFYKHLSNQTTSWNRVSPIDKHMEACLFPTMLHSHCSLVVLLLGGNWGDTTFLLSVHEIVSFLQHKMIIESNSSLLNKVFCQAFYYCSKCVVTCTYLYLQFWAILPIIAHNYTILKGRNLLLSSENLSGAHFPAQIPTSRSVLRSFGVRVEDRKS